MTRIRSSGASHFAFEFTDSEHRLQTYTAVGSDRLVSAQTRRSPWTQMTDISILHENDFGGRRQPIDEADLRQEAPC